MSWPPILADINSLVNLITTSLWLDLFTLVTCTCHVLVHCPRPRQGPTSFTWKQAGLWLAGIVHSSPLIGWNCPLLASDWTSRREDIVGWQLETDEILKFMLTDVDKWYFNKYKWYFNTTRYWQMYFARPCGLANSSQSPFITQLLVQWVALIVLAPEHNRARAFLAYFLVASAIVYTLYIISNVVGVYNVH